MRIRQVEIQRFKPSRLLLLTSMLIASGCAANGQLVCPSEYQQVAPLPVLPADRMVPPMYQQRLSEEFFGSERTQTTQSDGSNPN